MVGTLAAVFLLAQALPAAAPRTCPGSVPAGTFQLRVQPPGGGPGRSIHRLNTIESGAKILYQPIDLPASIRKDAKVALLLAPADTTGPTPLTVLDLKPAAFPADWTTPFRPGIAVLVFGPQGLDEKRVTTLIGKDEDLVAQMADYAEQTSEMESAVDSIVALDDAAEEDPRPDRATPAEQAVYALLHIFNPATTAYNPLGGGRVMSPVTTSGKVAAGFFENAGSVVPGGGVLPGLKTVLFPDTEFRAVFVHAGTGDALTLCAQRQQARTRNKIAYLWAHRIPNSPKPSIALVSPASLPIGARGSLPVRARPSDWQSARHIDGWTFISADNRQFPVSIAPALAARAFEADLRKFSGAAGAYKLKGQWDWSEIELPGEIRLYPLPDLKSARVTPDSAARMVQGTGRQTLALAGADFQFVERATLRNARAAHAADVDFLLPDARGGPQASLEVDVDTNALRPGVYLLALSQAGGAPQEVPVHVRPAPPRIDNLPLKLNTGAGPHKVELRGDALDRIQSIECDRAKIELGPAAGGASREAAITLAPGLNKGDALALTVKLDGSIEPARIENAIRVLGPPPRIAGIKIPAPEDLTVALREGELPGGSFVTALMKVDNVDASPSVRFKCGEGREAAARGVTWSRNDGTVFVSFDGSDAGSGCTLEARIETESAGVSEPAPVGKLVRVPKLEAMALAEEKAEGGFAGTLRGLNLETIERTGWDAKNGLPVSALPAPVAGEGAKQTLRISMPWPPPSPHAPLYIWLRGDAEGRATRLRY